VQGSARTLGSEKPAVTTDLQRVRELAPTTHGRAAEPEQTPLDLFDAALATNPYAIYAEIRAKRSVHYISPSGRPFAVLSRYADVQLALRDPRFGREDFANRLRSNLGDGPLGRSFARWMLFHDPPDHTRLRSLVMRAFTPRAVEHLNQRIHQIVNQLLDLLDGRHDFDLIADFAGPLPVLVICELLGVPVEDRHLFAGWSTALAASLDNLTSPFADILDKGNAAAAGLTDYFRDLLARRRETPTDDLLTGLLQATEAGAHLTEEELLATCVLLFFAGHETTVNLIGNGMLALFRHPDQLEHLRRTPASASTAVEEILRFDSPVQRSSRVALADVELTGGEVVNVGETVALLIGAANHDPLQFPNPGRLDLTRTNASRHLSFGAGIHYCLGAPLARLEAQVAIAELLRRLPSLRLCDRRVSWRPTFGLRGLAALHVASGASLGGVDQGL
jgi:cytochrome P450